MCLAIPGRIVSISGDEPLFRHGKVDFGGIVKDVSLVCTPEQPLGAPMVSAEGACAA